MTLPRRDSLHISASPVRRSKPVVVIATAKGGGVRIVLKELREGLKDRYTFVAHDFSRRFGNTRHGRLSLLNLFYLPKDLIVWILRLLYVHPAIAHYPLTSRWAAEKGVLFLWVARTLRIKTVAHFLGSFLEFWDSLSATRKWILKKGFAHFNAIVTPSERYGSSLVERTGVSPGKVFVVNHVIEADLEQSLLKLPVGRLSSNVLNLGYLSRKKGVLDVIEASRIVSKSRNFHLDIVGAEREPQILEECSRRIREYEIGDKVSLRGGASEEEKRHLFEDSNIFTLASYHENFPLVVLEAAAAGLAIIATPVGALPEFFEDQKSIIFVPPGDVSRLAQALVDLLSDSEKRVSLGRAAREVFVTRLSRDRVMNSMDLVYRRVLEN